MRLPGNQLTQLPSQIGELKNLQTLDLTYNQLTILPVKIANLTALQTLNLQGNPISEQEIAKIRQYLPKCSIIY